MKTKPLKTRYEAICKEYIDVFCEKQGMEFEFWVAEIVGGIAVITILRTGLK